MWRHGKRTGVDFLVVVLALTLRATAEEGKIAAVSQGMPARQRTESRSETIKANIAAAAEAPPSLMRLADLEWHEKRKTPEAQAKVIDDALLALDRAKSARAEAQAAAQERLSQLSAALGDASLNVARLKARADAVDEELLACRSREKERLRQIGDEAATLKQEYDAKEELCQKLQKFSRVEWSLSNTSGRCDFSSSEPCGSVASLVAKVREFRSNVDEMHAKYKAGVPLCNEARDAFFESVKARVQLRQDTIRGDALLKDTCDNVQTNAHNAMCTFGVQMQDMCALKKAALALESDLSEQRKELSSVRDVRCWLLSQHPNGTDGCRSMDDIDIEAPSATQWSVACSEPSITFSSFVWRTGSTFSDYVKEVYSPAFTLEPVGAPPFEFCATDYTAPVLTTLVPEGSILARNDVGLG
jgi:hypothetical protein